MYLEDTTCAPYHIYRENGCDGCPETVTPRVTVHLRLLRL